MAGDEEGHILTVPIPGRPERAFVVSVVSPIPANILSFLCFNGNY
jgi:hypothetical protein